MQPVIHSLSGAMREWLQLGMAVIVWLVSLSGAQHGPPRRQRARCRGNLGHKTRSISDRYNTVSDKDLTEAASRIEAGTSSPVWAESGHSPEDEEKTSAV
jgi:hypothetical protein